MLPSIPTPMFSTATVSWAKAIWSPQDSPRLQLIGCSGDVAGSYGKSCWLTVIRMGSSCKGARNPGRFYASLITKLVLMHFLLHYDFELHDKRARLSRTWRTSIVPCSSTRLLMRPRKKSDHLGNGKLEEHY